VAKTLTAAELWERATEVLETATEVLETAANPSFSAKIIHECLAGESKNSPNFLWKGWTIGAGLY
jgi:hypothetical protein